jgi:hypothetical protein
LALQDVPTCQDTSLNEEGSQKFVCPEGWIFNNASMSVILTKEECCLVSSSSNSSTQILTATVVAIHK